jgi:hypothetical protein
MYSNQAFNDNQQEKCERLQFNLGRLMQKYQNSGGDSNKDPLEKEALRMLIMKTTQEIQQIQQQQNEK